MTGRITLDPGASCGAALLTLQRGAQTFTCVARRAYKTRTGRPTTVLTWRAACAACGASFEFVTGARSIRPFDLPRRCKAHRQPGVPVEARPRPVKDARPLAGLILAELERRPGQTSTQIRRALKRRSNTVHAALREMLAAGTIQAQGKPGPGHRVRYVLPMHAGQAAPAQGGVSFASGPGGTPAALHADDVDALLELERDR